MKPQELLFLAVAFFLGYFANTVINMTCGRSVVEGAENDNMEWVPGEVKKGRLTYIPDSPLGTGTVPACSGKFTPNGCDVDSKAAHHTYAGETETKLVQCPIGGEKMGTVCCDSGEGRYSQCKRGGRYHNPNKTCCFWEN
tara:strand:+ start:1515 stop:1934 length:420 start_codon:yes stop_codon:yes gene_type:complete